MGLTDGASGEIRRRLVRETGEGQWRLRRLGWHLHRRVLRFGRHRDRVRLPGDEQVAGRGTCDEPKFTGGVIREVMPALV
ncbi:hypothetical protein ACFQ0B_56505 [Nonomuraea thailandensis]